MYFNLWQPRKVYRVFFFNILVLKKTILLFFKVILRKVDAWHFVNSEWRNLYL